MKNLYKILLLALILLTAKAVNNEGDEFDFGDEDLGDEYGDEDPTVQALTDCYTYCLSENNCDDIDGECFQNLTDIDQLQTYMSTLESCQFLTDIQTQIQSPNDEFYYTWEDIFYAQQYCYYEIGDQYTDEDTQNAYWCQGECITEFIYSYYEQVEYGHGSGDSPELIHYEDIMHCQEYCYEAYECDKTCAKALDDNFDDSGPACTYYNENWEEDAAEFGEEWFTLKTMSSFVGCLHENRQNFYGIVDGEQILDCAISCFEGYEDEFGGDYDGDADGKGGDGKKDDCDDFTCYYELFKCNDNCIKVNCPNFVCVEEKILKDNMASNKNCKYIDDFETDNTKQIAPLTYTDNQVKCANHMMTIFTEDVPTALFTCFKTCAEKAIEENDKAAQGDANRLQLALIVLGLVASLLI